MSFQEQVIDTVNDLRNLGSCNPNLVLHEKLGGRLVASPGGHAFLVVQGMIVDLWASDHYDYPVVVHLKHEDTVRRLYGDPDSWEVLPV